MLTVLVLALLTFFMTESLQREHVTKIGPIFYSTSVPSSAVLFGKAVANSALAVVVVIAGGLGCWTVFAITWSRIGTPPSFELWPFLLVWGALLFPTFFAWTAFVALVQCIGCNRYLTYGVAFCTVIMSCYYWITGRLNWAWDWCLMSSLRWTDMGALQLNGMILAWNRVLVLMLAVLFTLAAVRFFKRRENDPTLMLRRLRPKNLAWAMVAFLPFLVPPAVVSIVIYRDIQGGFQGGRITDLARDYWRRNLSTYRDRVNPRLEAVELDVEIEPATSWFSVDGTYRLANRDTERMPQIAMTPGLWDDLEWSLDGQPFEPVDRSGLAVFPLPEPLEPAQEAVIGFRYHGKLPRGVSRRGGGSMHLILPAGVVLDDFTTNFVPMVGYQEGIGIREENRYEPPEYPDDFHEEMLAPHERRASLFSTRITVTGPQDVHLQLRRGAGEFADERREAYGDLGERSSGAHLQYRGRALGSRPQGRHGCLLPPRSHFQHRGDVQGAGRRTALLLRVVSSLPLEGAPDQPVSEPVDLRSGLCHQHRFFRRERLHRAKHPENGNRLRHDRPRDLASVVG